MLFDWLRKKKIQDLQKGVENYVTELQNRVTSV